MPNSLTELDAVKPRGPRIFVALVAAMGLAVGAWMLFGRDTDGPIGEPEDAARIVLLGAELDVTQVLPQLGLEVEATDLQSLAERAWEEGAPAEASAVDAALHWADLHGYGYVAFANPSDVDFGTRPVSRDSADLNGAHGFAVFSVGDFATPTKVTVDPLPATYEAPAYVELLRALFEQDRLAATLLAQDNLSIEAKPLYEKIRAAIDLKGAYGLVDQRARASEKDYAESVVAEEEADPKPAALRSTLEETRAWPLANGNILLLVTAPSLLDPHSEDVNMSWNAEPRVFVVDAAGKRTRCAEQDAWANADVRVDASGTAVLVGSAKADSYDVFTVSKDSPDCTFRAAGSLRTTHVRGALSPTAQLAWLRPSEGGVGDAMLEFVRVDEEHPLQWVLPGCHSTYGLDWLGPEHIAVLCQVEHAPDPAAPDALPEVAAPRSVRLWVYLLDITTGEILALPWDGTPARSYGLFRVAGDTLTLLARSGDGTLEIGTLKRSLPELLAAPPLDPEAPPAPAGADGVMHFLSKSAVELRLVEVDDSADVPVVSPTGGHVSYAVDSGRRFAQNLAVLDLRTGAHRRVAVNKWAQHRRPTFTSDGAHLVFTSLYSLRDGEGHVAQIVAVP